MKVDIILGWIFGFIVVTALFVTLHEYIHYKLDRRQKKKVKQGAHPVQGTYFNRFVPLSLKSEFQKKIADHEAFLHPKHGIFRHLITGSFVVVYIICLSLFFDKQSHKLFKSVDLTNGEKKDLNLTKGRWKEVVNIGHDPVDEKLFREFVFIKNTEESLINMGIEKGWTYRALKEWSEFTKYMGFGSKICHWERVSRCAIDAQKQVVVVLPGAWNSAQIKNWLDLGVSVLLYGAHLQLSSKNPLWQVHDFEMKYYLRQKRKTYSTRVSADKLLTAGLDGGLFIYQLMEEQFTTYKVEVGDIQATTTSEDAYASGDIDNRLWAKKIGKGRLVWTDISYSPKQAKIKFTDDNLRLLYLNISKFLIGQAYSGIAAWPEGKSFASFVEQDTEDKYENTANVVSVFVKHGFPVTWYILSDLAEKHKRLTRRLASVGEVACHGDNHDVFPDGSLYRQVYRLAKCKKVLKGITGKEAVGFRPPEEKHNTETFDAVSNNDFDYIFADFGADRGVPKILFDSKNNVKLVSLGRIVRDDYHLWGLKKFSDETSIHVLNEDILWAKALGSLFSFSFHSQYMGTSGRIDVIDNLLSSLKTQDTYIGTSKDIADWWLYRHSLITGEVVSPEGLQRFKPVRIRIDSEGEIHREVITSL